MTSTKHNLVRGLSLLFLDFELLTNILNNIMLRGWYGRLVKRQKLYELSSFSSLLLLYLLLFLTPPSSSSAAVLLEYKGEAFHAPRLGAKYFVDLPLPII